jgi:CelD/BcsL family acetyltransferase involved in cellulose biosynthesis
MNTLRVAIASSPGALDASARELWTRAEPHLQFDQTLGWTELLAQHASEPGEDVCIVTAGDANGRCHGLLPLKVSARNGLLSPRYARSLANYYSSLYAPIVGADVTERPAVLNALLDGVGQLTPSIDGLDLNPLQTGDRSDATVSADAPAIAAALQLKGWSTETYFRFGNWILDVGGRSYEAYFGGLSSQLRNTVKRKEKKLRAMPGLQIDIAQAPDDAQRALAYYERIYAASWKNPEPHPRFVPSLVRFLSERGWLRMGCVSLGNEPVAAQIWAVKDGIASIFKLAYDERFAQVSAGSVLTAHLMRHVIDVDRVHTVDYLTGDDSYKRDWMSYRRERVGVRAHRRGSWRGQLALLADRVKGAVRPLLRRN